MKASPILRSSSNKFDKEITCAGDPHWFHRLGRSTRERDRLPLNILELPPAAQRAKKITCQYGRSGGKISEGKDCLSSIQLTILWTAWSIVSQETGPWHDFHHSLKSNSRKAKVNFANEYQRLKYVVSLISDYRASITAHGEASLG